MIHDIVYSYYYHQRQHASWRVLHHAGWYEQCHNNELTLKLWQLDRQLLLQMEYKCSKHWIWVCFTDIFIGKLNSYMCTVRVRPAHSMRRPGEAWACACARPWLHERSVISIVGQHRSLATFVTKASIIGGYKNRWILVCGPVCFGIDTFSVNQCALEWILQVLSGPCSACDVLWKGSFLMVDKCALEWIFSHNRLIMGFARLQYYMNSIWWSDCGAFKTRYWILILWRHFIALCNLDLLLHDIVLTSIPFTICSMAHVLNLFSVCQLMFSCIT